LIDNALAHTDPGGTVTLSAEEAGNAVRLTVSDTGRGIPPEHLPHLFEKFFRIPDGQQPTGTGLGLAISSLGVTIGPPIFGWCVTLAGGFRGPWLGLAFTIGSVARILR